MFQSIEFVLFSLKFSSVSCPVCNSPGEASGRVYLDLDISDIEYFLVNNPRIFNDLVNRLQNILDQPRWLKIVMKVMIVDLL